MEFKKYESIRNLTGNGSTNLERLQFSDISKEQFCVIEKIHGANVTLLFDDSGMEIYKRSGVAESEFFNARQELLYDPQLLDVAYKVYDLVKKIQPKATSVGLHGEYFGGAYNHPLVAREPNAVCIQGRNTVSYSPKNHLLFFDVSVTVNGHRTFLSVKTVRDMFVCFSPERYLYLEPDFVGTLQECIDFSAKTKNANSELYKYLGLREAPVEDNIREGNIIRPFDKSLFMGTFRVIFKDKSAEHSKTKKVKAPKTKVNLTGEEQQIEQTLFDLVSESRLESVISHSGKAAVFDNFGPLTGLMAKDLLDEFKSCNNALWAAFNALEKPRRKVIMQQATNTIAGTIRKYILEGSSGSNTGNERQV